MKLTMRMILLAALAGGPAVNAYAQTCPYRGQLDDLYCDADRDMVADPPADKSKWKNPGRDCESR